MAKIDLDRDRIEKLVREAVHDSDQRHDKEFENFFEEWLYYTIATETIKVKNQILQEYIDEMNKLIL